MVGDAEKPQGAVTKYCVVYPIPGGSVSGSLGDPEGDAELVYQVTCVGRTREQAEWVVNKAMGLTAGFNVVDRHIARVFLDTPSGVTRDDQADPPLFYATPRFKVLSFTT
jgi:hypothetical protein